MPDVRLFLVAGVATLTACSAEAPEPNPVTVRDSAGIRIVENHAPRLTGSNSWRVEPAPQLEIGGADEDSTQTLHNVVGAYALSDGRIVLAHQPAPMLRWYSPQGQFLFGAGRPGGGPGEFGEGESAFIHALWPHAGDSVATWEHSARRMQVFDPAGRYTRAVTIDLPPRMDRLAYPQITGRLAGGFLVFMNPPHAPGALNEVVRDSMPYLQYDAQGKYIDVLARLPGFESITIEHELRGRTIRTEGRRPFARFPLAWTHEDRFYYGSSDRYEIAQYDASRQLRQLIRRVESPRQLTASMIADYKRSQLSDTPERLRIQTQRSLDNIPFPDSSPAYRRIRVDREGALWVQEYDLPGATTATWSVFDRDGVWLSNIVLPVAARVMDIGRDYILLLERGELDVERIRRYALQGRSRPRI